MFKPKNIIPTGIAHNAISTGTFVKGDIIAEEDLRIDGKVEGNIECSGKMIIGSNAQITGNIYCNNIDLMGKVNGNIEAKDTVTLKSQVNFSGKIITKYLDIESGAIFNGTCTMQSESTSNTTDD